MELDKDFIKAFARLQISNRELTNDNILYQFDESAPLMPRKQMQHPSYKQVPQFFKGPPLTIDKMRQMLRQEGRKLFLHQRTEELLTADELLELYEKLEEHANKTPLRIKKTISYQNYCKLQAEISKKCRKYLTAKLFNQLNDLSEYVRSVELAAILKYTMRKMLLVYYRISLTEYDDIGHGYLRKIDLERYIIDKIPELAQLRDNMPKEFQIFYVCSVLKQCFFFLDPMHTGRIQISDLLCSGFVSRFMELGDAPQQQKMFVSPDSLEPNIFSIPIFLEKYTQYLRLDADRNGLLSQKEMAKYGSGNLNSFLIKRIFEECPTYNGGIDYKIYLDITLVLENLESMTSLNFIFRMLDVHHMGYLTTQTLYPFFKGLEEIMVERGVDEDLRRFDDFCNVVFDMAKPRESWKITLKDLKYCKQIETILSYIIDFDKFCDHDYQEYA